MITRSNRNRKNDFNTLYLASKGFVVTAIAAAVLSSTAYAQTNSSSGINRQSATEAAKAPATTPKTTPARSAVTTKKITPKIAKAKRARRSTATAIRPVKITIHGDRTDARMARQQGMQSLQNANAAVAERNAEAAAAAADNAAAANDAALANAQNNYYNNQPYYGYGYGYLPTFINAGNPNGYGPNLPYGSVSTTAPIGTGVPSLGAPTVNFPSYYTNYTPGVFSTYTSSPYGSTFGMYGF